MVASSRSEPEKHFHVWEFRSSWREWRCQTCGARCSSEQMQFLHGGPFDAATMSREELEVWDAMRRL